MLEVTTGYSRLICRSEMTAERGVEWFISCHGMVHGIHEQLWAWVHFFLHTPLVGSIPGVCVCVTPMNSDEIRSVLFASGNRYQRQVTCQCSVVTLVHISLQWAPKHPENLILNFIAVH